MSLKLPFEQNVELAKLAVADMEGDLISGDVDSFMASGWAGIAAIERAMQEVLTIKLGQLRPHGADE